jgi:prepilin-type N-terminal cleavage/methylation domain-containing protein/prepilin-type processing-associated H-X9-DG protein
MKLPSSLRIPISHRRVSELGLTLMELLIVIAIIGVLMALMVPGVEKAKLMANYAKNTANIREIGLATITWASDRGNKLPSPEYPGGMEVPNSVSAEDYFPEYWDLGPSGLWLDGVVFAQIYMRENKDGDVTKYEVNEQGEHLKGTLFENTISVLRNPQEEDWHRHSYAMNKNLQYDRIYDQVSSTDPYLTEKTLSNLIFSPKALLYIDCIESNVIDFNDRSLLEETSEERYKGGKLMAVFLDGHAERLTVNQIPDEDPESDRESSRFWRGVDPR